MCSSQIPGAGRAEDVNDNELDDANDDPAPPTKPLYQSFFRMLADQTSLAGSTLDSYKVVLNALEQWLEDNPQDDNAQERTLAQILTARGDAAHDQTLQQCKLDLEDNDKTTHLFLVVNTVRQVVKAEDYRLIDSLLAKISAKFNTDCYKVALTALADWMAQNPQDQTLAQILAKVGRVDDNDEILLECKRHLEACGMTDAATYLIPAVNAVRPVNTDRGNLPEPDFSHDFPLFSVVPRIR
ncbi:hypothetical protein C6558_31815 [Ensifer sp. NM-2]|uniref:hypothetical protein n=1 Tax=Ensifer sp. NM-2 TaxID=2109730 RepID=UPI000D1167D9|nr:hypothetical protein [Ensifer sp. NM-2]PSS60574.1 hypothetical protein C6558_31815 [Ensifer sp. NM-2]